MVVRDQATSAVPSKWHGDDVGDRATGGHAARGETRIWVNDSSASCDITHAASRDEQDQEIRTTV